MSSQYRYLGMPGISHQEWIQKLNQSAYLELGVDSYNEGATVALLESRVADLLGKPSALFFTKGMTAQFAMLMAASEKADCRRFAMHPVSHIAWDESGAFKHLLGLEAVEIGTTCTAYTAAQLQAVDEKLSTAVVELPLRRAGFRLPDWEELLKIQMHCNEQGIHLHMDGARLWESITFYDRSEAEISSLFDSVYVSFYKGLGGIGGAILAGEHDFIDSCKVWRTRLAGDNFTAFPQLLTALDGLDRFRTGLPALVKRAKQIAAKLDELDGLVVFTPQTNGFVIFLDGDADKLNARAEQLSEQTGLKLFRAVTPYPRGDQLSIEIQIGHQHELISDQEIVNYFKRLLEGVDV